MEIFANKNKRRTKARWNELYPIDSWIDLNDIDRPFLEEEILKAINDMHSDKAPGPNAFPFLFYKQFNFGTF